MIVLPSSWESMRGSRHGMDAYYFGLYADLYGWFWGLVLAHLKKRTEPGEPE